MVHAWYIQGWAAGIPGSQLPCACHLKASGGALCEAVLTVLNLVGNKAGARPPAGGRAL
jgi:hypothetical protein